MHLYGKAECRLNEKHVALPLLFIVRDAELALRALNASRPDVSRRPSPPLERGTKSLTEHASRSSTGTLLSHTMVPKTLATYRHGSREGMSSEAAATLSRRYTRSFQGLPGPRTVHGDPEEPLLAVAAVFSAWLLVGSPTADSWHVGLSAWPAVKTGGTGFASDGVCHDAKALPRRPRGSGTRKAKGQHGSLADALGRTLSLAASLLYDLGPYPHLRDGTCPARLVDPYAPRPTTQHPF